MPTLECCYPLPANALGPALQAVRHRLEDLAFTQVGRWVPFEVRLILPQHLLETDVRAMRQACAWLASQGYAWRILGSQQGQAHLSVRCRAANGVHHTRATSAAGP